VACRQLQLTQSHQNQDYRQADVDVVLSSRFGEQSDEEGDGGNGNGQWDGKTRWNHLPKVNVKAKRLGVIGNKLHDRIQKELNSYFPFPND
jgi:hypothetical protein